MARIRTIKPEFNTSESVARLSRDSQLFFLKLLTECDDYGRVRWLPKKIAGDLYPYSEDVGNSEVQMWGEDLEREDILAFYVVDGSTYARFKNWDKHQRVDKPGKSSIPAPEEDQKPDDSRECRESVAKVSRLEKEKEIGKGIRKGKEDCDSRPLVAADQTFDGEDLPESLEFLRPALLDWIAYRRSSKLKPWKAETWRARFKLFQSMPDPEGAIRHSIANGYQGLFEPKSNGSPPLVSPRSFEQTVSDNVALLEGA